MLIMDIKDLPENWDIVIVGGGITGAGIFREAVRMGLKVLLVERMDYAWGTSSRSSKLVHGGLRYLGEGQILMTKACVEERERLLNEAPGLVELLGFLMPVYKDQKPGKKILNAGLALYDLMAREKRHKFYGAHEFSMMAPHIKQEGLIGGFRFFDAQVDDARLVLRLINEGVESGGCALNYTSVIEIRRNERGEVIGVVVEDTETQLRKTLSAAAVINATGPQAEELHPSPEPKRHIRPLRGSHLVFPSWVLPVAQAMCFVHPRDNRMVFVIPWEGAVLFGTTDVDHMGDISEEPAITEEEITYLMEGLRTFFPSLDISLDNCISTFAGIRPVLSEGEAAPSEESRDHVVWEDKGLVTITGGKLTTFRRLAWDALKAVRPFLPSDQVPGKNDPVFSVVPERPKEDYGLSLHMWERLYGRYGKAAEELVAMASPDDLTPIPGTCTLWAEIPFAAKHEQVRHLADLLLRRVRIGLLTPWGGKEYIDRIKKICQSVLPWDDRRWNEEIDMYMSLWMRSYALPGKEVPIIAKREGFFSRSLDFLETLFPRCFRVVRTLAGRLKIYLRMR
ncbi:MAG: glycerol-3-phosphate dehydrogenase/oxidase [Proteobacteria bacterium]|nr:glycerol-3-phosphate dehydrogenase/oxidase [Pseudomonadota bacterium]